MKPITITFSTDAKSGILTLMKQFDFNFGYDDVRHHIGNLTPKSAKVTFQNINALEHREIDILIGDLSAVVQQWNGDLNPSSHWLPCTNIGDMLYYLRKCADAAHRNVWFKDIIWEEANEIGVINLAEMNWPEPKKSDTKGGVADAQTN